MGLMKIDKYKDFCKFGYLKMIILMVDIKKQIDYWINGAEDDINYSRFIDS